MKNNNFGSLRVEGYTLWSYADVINSEVGENSIIGDFSRIYNSVLGKYTRIDRNNLLKGVKIDDYSYSGPFCMIFNSIIGKFCSISYGVTIGPPEHEKDFLTTHPFIYDSSYKIFQDEEVLPNMKFDKLLEIGNDVWIGCNVTILRGIKIGNGAIIGANSLVNKDVPPYAIVAGCPARIINYRFDREIRDLLKIIKWWDWDYQTIKRNNKLFKIKGNDLKDYLQSLL